MGLIPTRLWPRRAWAFVGVALCLGMLNGCVAEAAPDLLDVRRVGPASLEAGQSLELGGSGFPERQEGRVTLEGTAFAAAGASRSVRLILPGVAESRTRVLVRLGDKQLSALCEGAEHVTFRGRVSLEFEPLLIDGPLLRGVRDDVVLDVFQRSADWGVPAGRPFHEFLGLAFDDGLVVTTVEPREEAARAGLLPGDRLLTLDGLRLSGPHDFYPAAGLDVSSLEFERPGKEGVGNALLDRAAYQPLAGAAAARALVVISALALALLIAARPPASIVWLFRGRRPGASRDAVGSRGWRVERSEHIAFLAVVVVLWLCQCAEAGALRGLRFGWLAFDLELALCLAGACTLLSAFALGGRRRAKKGGFSLWRGTSNALGAGCLLLPILFAAVARASETGSMRLSDLSRAQGSSAFAFAIFESPWTLLLGLAFLGSLVPRAGFRSPLALSRGGTGGEAPSFARGLASVGLVLFVGLWVVLFLGGIEGPRIGSVWGGFWFSLKVAMALGLVRGLSARLSELRSLESLRFFGPALFASSLVGFGLFALSGWSRFFDAHFDLLHFGVVVMVGCAALLLGISASRALGHAGRSADPWI